MIKVINFCATALMTLACIAPTPAQAAASRGVTIPAGTRLPVRLSQSVTSEQSVGKKFNGVLENSVKAGGSTVIRSGTTVYGEIVGAIARDAGVGAAIGATAGALKKGPATGASAGSLI
jgi:hypothetical protein